MFFGTAAVLFFWGGVLSGFDIMIKGVCFCVEVSMVPWGFDFEGRL